MDSADLAMGVRVASEQRSEAPLGHERHPLFASGQAWRRVPPLLDTTK